MGPPHKGEMRRPRPWDAFTGSLGGMAAMFRLAALPACRCIASLPCGGATPRRGWAPVRASSGPARRSRCAHVPAPCRWCVSRGIISPVSGDTRRWRAGTGSLPGPAAASASSSPTHRFGRRATRPGPPRKDRVSSCIEQLGVESYLLAGRRMARACHSGTIADPNPLRDSGQASRIGSAAPILRPSRP